MTWFKVDDGLHSHPKAFEAGTPALGLWVRAGSWSADQLTDGFVPRDVARLYGTPAMAKALVKARLWIEVEGGYRFHQWNSDGRQPTRESVLAERDKKAAAGRAGGVASGQSRRSGTGSKTGSKTEAPASQIVAQTVEPPSRPVPFPLNPSLITLVCRRLFGDARRNLTDDERSDLWSVWAETAGPGVDLEAELRTWLIHNTATDLHNPGAALLGWLRTAARRAAIPALPGCDRCVRGWLPDEFGQPSANRCVACRSHLQAVGTA